MKKYAIISVYYKDNVEVLAKALEKAGYIILSSGGTYNYLKSNGINSLEKIEDFGGNPEILQGRVKTLQYKIYAGLLARNTEEHKKELEQLNIPFIDVVVVNFYPFEEKVLKENAEDFVEYIDVGGPTLVRAGAKNFERVLVVVDPMDYDWVAEKILKGDITLEVRAKLASKAFRYLAYYDSIIAEYLSSKYDKNWEEYKYITFGYKVKGALRYGENPHQKAVLLESPVVDLSKTAGADFIGGKKLLSFNNYLDIDSTLRFLKAFKEENFAVIIKHNNPCGAGIAENILEAFRKAFAGDPKSAFGGIIGITRPLTLELAKEIAENFFEVIVAPDFQEEAIDFLSTKRPNLRLVRVSLDENEYTYTDALEFRWIDGGGLLQEKDKVSEDKGKFVVVTKREPSKEEWEDLLFAWKVVAFVKSNAIVIAKDKMLIGVGGGQVSRVDAVELAIKKAKEHNPHLLQGAALASDAFFPFRDNVDVAGRNGISAIIQPGGSVRDKESIDAANEYNIAMVFTSFRHFRH